MKVRIWARVARAFFNSMGITILAIVSGIIGTTAVNLITLHLDAITVALYPELGISPVPVLPAIGLSLAVFFAFLAGGMGIAQQRHNCDRSNTATATNDMTPRPTKCARSGTGHTAQGMLMWKILRAWLSSPKASSRTFSIVLSFLSSASVCMHISTFINTSASSFPRYS